MNHPKMNRSFRFAAFAVAASALAAGYLVLRTAGLCCERDTLLVKLASMMAHESIDSENRNVVGEVCVKSVGGTQYRAAGKVMIGQQMSDWTFTFFNDADVPTVPVDIHIRAKGAPPSAAKGETTAELN